MKLKMFFLSVVVGLSFMACSNDNDDVDGIVPEGSDTYVNLSISLAGAGNRAIPEDYNPDGDYQGNDLIQTLDIYMVSTSGAVEAKRFTGADLAKAGTVISPSQPFRTTSGQKTVYVVINSPNALQTAAPGHDEFWPIAGLASMQNDADVIAMTGQSGLVTIEPDITQQAVIGGANNVSVIVQRIASRVIVTSTASNELLNNQNVRIGTISDVTYSVAQGTNQVYALQHIEFDAQTNAVTAITWGTDYVPALGDYTTEAVKYYDYSDLSNPTPVPARPTAADGYKSLPGKFLFENSHYAGTVTTSQYKKGNTAYVLVRATLTPDASAIADGGALTNGTFYVGESDGLIYSSKQAAQTAVQNQRVAVYQGGKMLQYAWLNPDNIQRPLNSPVVRNNIYHINITAFKQIGLNWNPLNPNPDNPDPKPNNPDEPDTPINPIDPLTPEETYMTVEVNVLNWTAHSYDIEL